MPIRQFQPSRTVQVFSPEYGSGYRIGGRLVLTAAHLLGDVGSSCELWDKRSFGKEEAQVVWKAQGLDIALVELPEKIADLEAITFGKLPEAITGEKLAFQMYAYPLWARTQREYGSAVGGRQIEGIIYLSDRSPDDLLVLEPERLPSEVTSSESEWAGASGAAIVCDGLVIAVQSQHQNPNRPASLEAAPLWMIYADEQWQQLLRRHGIDPDPEIVLFSRKDETKRSVNYAEQVILQPDGRQVPFLAPPKPSHAQDGLVGRDSFLKDLESKFTDGGSFALSALKGLPGVGKTAIAIELAHRMAEHFQDGILWVGLGRTPDIAARLSDWAIALGIPPKDIANLSLEDKGRAIRTKIGKRRMLLIIDDAWKISAALAFKLGGNNCTHLLTTRLPQIALDFAGELGCKPVIELSLEEGLILIRKIAPKVVEAEEEEARELVKAVDGLPLALALIGRYLAKEAYNRQLRRIRSALERLKKIEERLQVTEIQSPVDHHPSLPSHIPLSLMAVIQISDEGLDKDASDALRALSVFPPKPNDFSEAAILAVCSTSEGTLDKLCDSGLLECNETGRYTLHQTISDYTRMQLIDVVNTEMRMIEFFVNYLEVNKSNYHLLSFDQSNISCALEKAFSYKNKDFIIRGSNLFFRFLDDRGLYEEAEKYLTSAEEMARHDDNSISTAKILRNLGWLARRKGNTDQTSNYYNEGLILANQSEDPDCISALLQSLGSLEFGRGNYSLASQYYQQGLPLARESQNVERIISLLQDLGSIEEIYGNHSQAENYYQQALELIDQKNDLEQRSFHRGGIGWVAAHNGDYLKAKEYWIDGLKIAEEIDNYSHIAYLKINLGWVADRLGQIVEAEEYFQQAMELAQKYKFRIMASALLMNRGAADLHRGNYAKARQDLNQAMDLARQFGSHQIVNILLELLGQLEIAQGNYEQAKKYLEDALETVVTRDYPERASALLTYLGEVRAYLGDYAQAEIDLQEGIKLAQRINFPERLSILFKIFGILATIREDFTLANSRFQEGLSTARKLGYLWLIGSILNLLGNNYLKQVDICSASSCFDEALEIGKKIDGREIIADSLYGIGRILAARGDIGESSRKGYEGLEIYRAIGHQKMLEVEQWIMSLPS